MAHVRDRSTTQGGGLLLALAGIAALVFAVLAADAPAGSATETASTPSLPNCPARLENPNFETHPGFGGYNSGTFDQDDVPGWSTTRTTASHPGGAISLQTGGQIGSSLLHLTTSPDKYWNRFPTLLGDRIQLSLYYKTTSGKTTAKARLGPPGADNPTEVVVFSGEAPSTWVSKSGSYEVAQTGTHTELSLVASGDQGVSIDGIAPTLTCGVEITSEFVEFADRDSSGHVNPGDAAVFRHKVANIGSASLKDLVVTDSLRSTVKCPREKTQLRSKDPNDVDNDNRRTTCVGTYILTDSDVDDKAGSGGVFTATASVKARDANESAVTADAAPVTSTTIGAAPSVTVVKKATVNDGVAPPSGQVDARDEIAYSYLVTNTGNVTLRSVEVTDPLAGEVKCPQITLASMAKTTCTATAKLTQTQIENGSLSGEAIVTATSPRSVEVTDAHTATTKLEAGPKITVVKTTAVDMTKAGPADRVDAGDTATYSYLVTNRGNVTLSKVSVIDAAAGTVTCSKTTLAPKATTTCTAAVAKLTQTQIDGGELGGATVDAATLKSGSTAGADTKTTTLAAVPAVGFDKAKTAPSGKVAPGGKVSYSFAVTNMGNVTLSVVSVADSKAGKVACPQTTVAPGKKTTCTATYTATDGDIAAGVISNRATVTAKAPDGKAVTADDSVSFDPDTGQVIADRHAGPERYSTAVEISKATFDPGVNAVYVATGVNFPDALAGSAASGGDGPILLVTKDAIPSATLAELKRLKPKRIIVLGGTGVVSQAVESALKREATTTRQSGADRYSTAAAISAKHFDPGAAVAFVATGEDFPDALTGGPAAAALGGPILLTQKTKLPSATVSELKRLKPKRIVVVGGTGVVSAAVQDALKSYTTGEVSRLAGADRYSTGGAISKDAFKPGVPVAYVATGANFPDALAGGAAGAFKDGPVLLVAGGTIPKATATELTRLKPKSIIVLGGEAVVPKTVQDALGAYIR